MRCWRVGLAAVLVWLGGCASRGDLVDDGRALDPNLLSSFQLYGQGERALRPALARAAELKDPDCDRQWELPFAVATAEGSEGDARLAWRRALGVDDRLTVIAATPGSGLREGDKLLRVGREQGGPLQLLETLGRAREDGRPFEVQTADGRKLRIQPFELCRGYARLAPPLTPKTQDYHWLMSLHPLELPQAAPNADEMLWAVLWTQGLSEEGGARMKTYHYTVQVGGTLFQIVSLASGLNAAAVAAKTAVDEARKQAASVLADFARNQLLQQGKELALQKLRAGMVEAGGQLARGETLALMTESARNRGALSGVSYIASTVWDRADAWAFQRMRKLGADPLAGLRLHSKMMRAKLAGNAFALDVERLQALSKLAEAQGLKFQLQAALAGFDTEGLDALLLPAAMPTARSSFSYQSDDDPGQGRFSRGLIEGLLQMPSAGAKP